MFHFGSTWGTKNDERIENLLQGVMQLLSDFEMNLMPILFCYISQLTGQ